VSVRASSYRLAPALVAAVFLATAGPLYAHAVFSTKGPFFGGLKHFGLSIEDVLAAIAVGIIAAQHAVGVTGKSILALAAGWYGCGAIGLNYGPSSSGADWIPAITVLVLGVLGAIGGQYRTAVPIGIAAATGSVHGFLNGMAMQPESSRLRSRPASGHRDGREFCGDLPLGPTRFVQVRVGQDRCPRALQLDRRHRTSSARMGAASTQMTKAMRTENLRTLGYRMRKFGRKGRIEAVAFWILVAAWICANNPQAAAVATMSWVKEAHRRSSHESLNLTVAQLLGGQSKAPAPTVEPAKTERAGKPPAVVHFTLKKLELASESTSSGLAPSRPVLPASQTKSLRAESRTYPPLLEPPRGELG
jgi:hydrogenase/urease accessory protein HupE